jgi:hypothetical protein
MDVRKQETGRTMAFIDKLVAWWKEELQRTKQLAKSGTKFRPWSPEAGMIDTTPADIARYEQKIAELDARIARHPEDK